MKILMFGWEFPPFNSGGLGVACKGLTRALAAEDVHVTFVLPKSVPVTDSYMDFRFPKGDIVFRSVDVMLSPYLTPQEYTSTRRLSTGGYARDLFGEVARYAAFAKQLATEEDFDVIHAHDWLAFSAGLAAKRATGKPLVLHVHLPSVDQGGGHGYDPRVFALEKEAFENADMCIAVSQRVKDSLVHDYGVPASKVTVVYNGLDIDDVSEFAKVSAERVSDLNEDPIALFMGRLTLHKAPDKFLDAAPLVLRQCPEARFIVAGSGEVEHQLIRQAAASGFANRVHFTGFVRDAERAKLLSGSDVLVMPSIAEPFGLVALEASASGTPVIVSKQSGVAEVLRHALKVDFWDTQSLANSILAVFKYQPLAQQLARAGGIEARAATWDHAALSCIGVYNNLVYKVA
jgi:glycosyltransferase involved in cell wall biosynthesis